jgi:hypothetical protein
MSDPLRSGDHGGYSPGADFQHLSGLVMQTHPQYRYSPVRLCLAAMVLACCCIAFAIGAVTFVDNFPVVAWLCGAVILLMGYPLVVVLRKLLRIENPDLFLSREALVFDYGLTNKSVRYSDIREVSIPRDHTTDDFTKVLNIKLHAVCEERQIRRGTLTVPLAFVDVNPGTLLAQIKTRMGAAT